MFLKKFKPTINSKRHKKSIHSFLSNFFILNYGIKKKLYIRKSLNNKFIDGKCSLFKFNLNDCYIYNSFVMLGYKKLSYTNRLMGIYKDCNNSIFMRPLNYGFNLTSIVCNNFMDSFGNKFNKNNYNIQKYICLSNFNNKFFFVFSIFKKSAYATSAGTYCLYTNINRDSNLLLIKLPSKKSIFLDYNTVGISGRNANVFHKYIYYNTCSYKLKLKKKQQHVRGICKNPVDHPNGGSSKVKKPFKTPWGLVAKKSK